MTVELIETADALAALAPAWDRLWHRDPNATPFQSPHWLLPWWDHFGSGRLAVLAVRDRGDLSALAPLFILRDDDTGETLGLLLGTGISDYLDCLLAPGTEPRPLLDAIDRLDCATWDLQQLRPGSPLATAPAPGGWTDEVEDHDCCPVAPIGEGRRLATGFMKKLRYSRRCAERLGPVEFNRATPETLDDLLTAFFDLHAAQWRRRGLDGVLADDVIQSFHRHAARRMLAAGCLRLHAMSIGGRVVAVFYGFAAQRTTFYYLSGYDPALAKLSLGTLLVAHAVEQAVREGMTEFDFLRGAEAYKHAWGATDRATLRRRITRCVSEEPKSE